jgi:mannose-6-phosphate isomerase-like protein (cupin superfamily)
MRQPNYQVLLHCVLAAGLVATVTGAEPAPPPAPNSPAIAIRANQLSEQIKAAVAKSVDPALGNIGDTREYFIHQVHREKTSAAYTHPGWTELHYILSGSGTLVTGGTIQGKPGALGNSIIGGVTQQVHKGDAIIVPAGTPHWYQKIDGQLEALEVRFVSPSASAVK